MTEKIRFITAVLLCKFTSVRNHLRRSGGSFYPGKRAVNFKTAERLFSDIYVSGTCRQALCDKFGGSCRILSEPIVTFSKYVLNKEGSAL